MKVIFLDIDGVLNCYTTKERINGILFVDPRKIAMLKEIVDATGANIVLSSTWRLGRLAQGAARQEFDALVEEMVKFGLSFYGYTPSLPCGYRGDEIAEWIIKESEKNTIDRFVILDDDGDLKPYKSRWIQTTWEKGLNQKHVRRAIKMLNE